MQKTTNDTININFTVVDKKRVEREGDRHV